MQQRRVETAGLTQGIVEAGTGPLVLLCHGFPELSWSWRAQLPALASAGFHSVAPDMRGYGETDRPREVEAYNVVRIAGDMVDLVRALGAEQAVIVGHDWGATVAWHAALFRPDIFRAVVGLSTPLQPRQAGEPPTAMLRRMSLAGDRGDLYVLRFQEPYAEAELDADVERAFRRILWAYDGGTPESGRSMGFVPAGSSFLESLSTPERLPQWIDERELARLVQAFQASGFSGPVNWYRNLDRNWELTAIIQDRVVDVPALFAVGENDLTRTLLGRAVKELDRRVPKLWKRVVVPGAGHWLQQERPEQVNELLIDFLRAL